MKKYRSILPPVLIAGVLLSALSPPATADEKSHPSKCDKIPRFLATSFVGTDFAGGNGQTILEFHRNAGGNIAPFNTIAGPHTGLDGVNSGLAFDPQGHLWVNSDPHHPNQLMEEFACGASGDATPIRVISGTDATVPVWDSDGHLWMNIEGQVAGVSGLARYADNASGVNPTPVQKISGPHTLLDGPEGFDFGPHGEIISVQSGFTEQGHYTNRIVVFAPNASGDATPIRVIEGPHTEIATASDIAVVGDKMFVNSVYTTPGTSTTAGTGPGGILEFNVSDNGDVAPLTVIRGPHTDLLLTLGMTYDKVLNRLVVGDLLGNRVVEFTPGDNGDVAPSNEIAGSNTGFSLPDGTPRRVLGAVVGPRPRSNGS